MQGQVDYLAAEGVLVVEIWNSHRNRAFMESLGGRPRNGSWAVPDSRETRSCLASYIGSGRKVAARVDADGLDDDDGFLQVGGYVLAERPGWHSMPVIGDGVSLVSGAFPRIGGSPGNPRVDAPPGMRFRLECRETFAIAMGLVLISRY